MKTVIVYVSKHHGNTKKLAEAIAANCKVTLIDGIKEKEIDLAGYDCIGFAAGIAFGGFYPQMLKLMKNSLPEGKKVFFLYTCGSKQKRYTSSAAKIAIKKGCTILDEYGCLGFDTFGPFKLIGGIAKGHPTSDELAKAVEFFKGISE
ncbi:MAG: flavodoxin domain-containing protein [Acutalibacteraceae bacterium]|jgi:flavodoxin